MKRILALFVFLFALNSALAQRTYKVGDYYDDGTKQGVVFEVDATGTHGKIVSLTQSKEELEWCSKEEYERKIETGASDIDNGMNNQRKIEQISNWREKYPAFAWCADQGEGWYLPAIEELKTLLFNDAVHDAVNRTLKAKGATNLYNKVEWGFYWSSTEHDYEGDRGWKFCAWGVNMTLGSTGYDSKNDDYYVRAVARFDARKGGSTAVAQSKLTTTQATRPAVKPTPALKPAQRVASGKRTYKVGDYYDDGTKQGVVFEVDATGAHGKIVSLTQSNRLEWCLYEEFERKIETGASDNDNGMNNQRKIEQISNWREKYPAFAWCADQGDGWYLPAIEELKTLLLNDVVHDAVNRTLKAKGATNLYNKGEWGIYWSSTEPDYEGDRGWKFCAWLVCMADGYTYYYDKYDSYYVRAVSAFDASAQSATNTRPTVKTTTTTKTTTTKPATTAKATPTVSKTNASATAPKTKPAESLSAAQLELKHAQHIARYDYIRPAQLIYTPLALFTSRDIPMDELVTIVDGTKGIGKVEVSTSADGKQKFATVQPTEFYCRLRGFEEMPCAVMSVGYDANDAQQIKSASFTYNLPASWKRAEVKAYAKAFSNDMHRMGMVWTEEKEGFIGTYKGHYIQIRYSGKGEDNFIYVYIRHSDQE